MMRRLRGRSAKIRCAISSASLRTVARTVAPVCSIFTTRESAEISSSAGGDPANTASTIFSSLQLVDRAIDDQLPRCMIATRSAAFDLPDLVRENTTVASLAAASMIKSSTLR